MRNFFKKIFKSKKGSAVIEGILMVPFVAYIIMYTAIKVGSLVAYSNIYKDGVNLINEVIVIDNGREALDKMASVVVKGNSDGSDFCQQIINIKISFLKSTRSPVELSFPMKTEGSTTSFLDFTNANGEFEWDRFYNSNSNNATSFEEAWCKDSIVEITLRRDLLQTFTDNYFHFKYIDIATGETKYAPIIVDSDLTMSTSGLIEN